MNKNIRNAVIVVAVAALAFTLMSFAKKPALTDDDKQKLFADAVARPVGGAAPPESIMQEYDKKNADAMAKIKELGLEKEFENWVNSRPQNTEEALLPQSQPM